jgi:hypothetical protein
MAKKFLNDPKIGTVFEQSFRKGYFTVFASFRIPNPDHTSLGVDIGESHVHGFTDSYTTGVNEIKDGSMLLVVE